MDQNYLFPQKLFSEVKIKTFSSGTDNSLPFLIQTHNRLVFFPGVAFATQNKNVGNKIYPNTHKNNLIVYPQNES